jgi:hypothetical protein
MRKGLLIVPMFLMLASPAEAHQPRIVGYKSNNQILDVQTSQAFYGKLAGSPARFLLGNDKPFNLYVQITSPDVPDAHQDWQVRIKRFGGNWSRSLPTRKPWEKMFEPFGGDHYLLGGELDTKVPAGLYEIKVSRPGMRGTYVLVVGKAEHFGAGDAVRALRDIPIIKHDYFNQGWLQAYLSRTVPLVLIFVVPLIVLIWLMLRKPKSQRSSP